MHGTRVSLILLSGALVACGGDPLTPSQRALATIDSAGLGADVRRLASDEFEGRLPSTRGEELTVAFLESRFRELGLQPGNGTSYVQEVPLVSITARPDAHLTVQAGGRRMTFNYGDDTMVWTKRVTDASSIRQSDMVFVGYGIVAPEFGWNDYAGIDVRGRTVVILVNDPGYATQDTALFRGTEMTYYGRWTYKYEEAARQGAAGALIVHEPGAAGYGWEVVANSWRGPQFDLVTADSNMSRPAVEGWISAAAAEQIMSAAGQDWAALRSAAATRGFRAVPLAARASASLVNTVERSTSRNVVAVLPGALRPDEVVVYTAHWDHLGRDTTLTGDQIFNGAVDNAIGTAGLIQIAEAFLAGERPARSIVFLAVTAEEQGLLGSRFYSVSPIFPPALTVAAVNLDAPLPIGRVRDVTVIGYGKSELDSYVEEAAAAQGRVVRADPEPEKGFYFRSDHFNFARIGVPAAYFESGVESLEHGRAWGEEQRATYERDRYHGVADEYGEWWDLAGVVEDLQMAFSIGYRLASESTFPNWSADAEFRAIRDSSRAGVSQ